MAAACARSEVSPRLYELLLGLRRRAPTALTDALTSSIFGFVRDAFQIPVSEIARTIGPMLPPDRFVSQSSRPAQRTRARKSSVRTGSMPSKLPLCLLSVNMAVGTAEQRAVARAPRSRQTKKADIPEGSP